LTSEIDAFRAELRAAGQPWSRRGTIVVAAGIVFLVAVQFVGQAAPFVALFFPLLIAATLLLAAGWVMLIMGVLRRRRWAKSHHLVMPSLGDAGGEAR
jgi:hypothetical protein